MRPTGCATKAGDPQTQMALLHGASVPRNNQGGLFMRRIPGFVLATLAVAAIGPVAASSAATVKVVPSNMNGWACFNDQNDMAEGCNLVSGPAPTPLGTGSAQLTAATSSEGHIIATTAQSGLKLSDFNGLEYWSYQPGPT